MGLIVTNEQLGERERGGVNGGSYDEQLSISKLAIVERGRCAKTTSPVATAGHDRNDKKTVASVRANNIMHADRYPASSILDGSRDQARRSGRILPIHHQSSRNNVHANTLSSVASARHRA